MGQDLYKLYEKIPSCFLKMSKREELPFSISCMEKTPIIQPIMTFLFHLPAAQLDLKTYGRLVFFAFNDMSQEGKIQLLQFVQIVHRYFIQIVFLSFG
jgi:hypothetical protein